MSGKHSLTDKAELQADHTVQPFDDSPGHPLLLVEFLFLILYRMDAQFLFLFDSNFVL